MDNDFSPPLGPPLSRAPEVPPGWVACWNNQYGEWFYANIHTKNSQWEKPNKPAVPPPPPTAGDELVAPPPSYTPQPGEPMPTMEKKQNTNELSSITSQPHLSGNFQAMSEDGRLARHLQAEEDARARGTLLQSTMPSGYSLQKQQPQYSQSPFPDQLPPRTQDTRGKSGGGLLSKLLGKYKTNYPGGSSRQAQSYPGGYPQQQGYGGYPQRGYGAYPQQPGYGAPGGYVAPPGSYVMHGGGTSGSGRKPGGGGMGMSGGLALGAGAGLLGAALFAEHVHNEQQEAYTEGYQDGNGVDGFGGDYDFGGDL